MLRWQYLFFIRVSCAFVWLRNKIERACSTIFSVRVNHTFVSPKHSCSSVGGRLYGMTWVAPWIQTLISPLIRRPACRQRSESLVENIFRSQHPLPAQVLDAWNHPGNPPTGDVLLVCGNVVSPAGAWTALFQLCLFCMPWWLVPWEYTNLGCVYVPLSFGIHR